MSSFEISSSIAHACTDSETWNRATFGILGAVGLDLKLVNILLHLTTKITCILYVCVKQYGLVVEVKTGSSVCEMGHHFIFLHFI